MSSGAAATTGASNGATTGGSSGATTGATSVGTTTSKCAQMQAVDEVVSKQITTSPTQVPQDELVRFQPTSKTGVTFPTDDKTPTIVVHFGTPALVQSVTIPRNQTPNANVQQFDVTFYSPNGTKITQTTSTFSPQDDNMKPAHLDSTKIPSDTPVSRVEITVTHTTDDRSPKGVILDIQACTTASPGKFR